MKQIPLTQNKTAIVDDSDYEYLIQWKWCAKKQRNVWYAYRRENGKRVMMHHEIVGKKDGCETDHLNGNGLDNRRCNLRNITHQQNQQNCGGKKNGSSKYKGVSFHKASGKYQVMIRHDNIPEYVGIFETELEAAHAYDAAAARYFGEFARLNFPQLQLNKRR